MTETRVKISSLIENQVPKYIRESSPLLIEFLRSYYISLDNNNILENIDQYIKVDYLTNIKKETILTNDISFSDNEIFVESTEGFPDSYGIIKINDEIISYENKSINSFINCVRGFSGIESYGESKFEKNAIFKDTSSEEHSSGSIVENLSILFLKEFLEKIKKQILPGFEGLDIFDRINESTFIKQSKDFYSSKGTKSSFQILFLALYGKNVDVIRTSDYVIEPSQSKYLVTKDLVVEPINGNINQLINQTIYQNEDEIFAFSSGTVTNIEKIQRNEKEYFILSLDYGYDRDIDSRGSIIGEFPIHPKTKIIGDVSPGQDYIDVDSTVGFPNSGSLVIRKNNIDYFIEYKSKTLSQFLECTIEQEFFDKSDIRFNTYAYGVSPIDKSEIRFRITGVLSDLNISDDNILSEKGDTIRIISPGKNLDDIRSKNWLYNIPLTYDISKISNDGTITTFDEHRFLPGDIIFIETENSRNTFKSSVSEVIDIDRVVINPPFTNINPFVKYKIKKIISKSKFRNYPEVSSVNSNVQNLYLDLDDNSRYITSPSLPNYFNNELNISDNSLLVSGQQRNSIIDFRRNHPFLTGDVIFYSKGTEGGSLNIDERSYYVKKITNRTIKISRSYEDILLDKFVSFDDATVIGDRINFLNLSNKKISSQKLVRKIDFPNNNDGIPVKTRYGSTGILLNGVEIQNYKSNDFIYYGSLEQIKVLSDIDEYDVLNPNQVIISDPNGKGAGASCILHISGSIRDVTIQDPGSDIIGSPSLTISGGNGFGTVIRPSLVQYSHKEDFNSQFINTSTNSIRFNFDHKFRDVENVKYFSNGNPPIIGLEDSSNYYLRTISSKEIKLYDTELDAINNVNSINFTSPGVGLHSIESIIKKNKIGTVKIENIGENYTNNKVVVNSSDVLVEKNLIFAKNHGYKDKDVIYYYSSIQEIGGVPRGNYYVKYFSKDEFALVNIVNEPNLDKDFDFKNNTIINFNNNGIGEHVFNYPEIELRVNATTSVNRFSKGESLPKITPTIKGKIKNVYIVSGGSSYGSQDILNYERQPSYEILEGKGALLSPVIVNGSIKEVIVLNGGKNYNSTPQIEVIGDGRGAILSASIKDGIIDKVNVISPGINYSKNTLVQVKNSNLNVRTKLKFKIKSWNINNYFRYSQFNLISDNFGILTESINENYGLQYKHISLPKDLRKLLFVSKIIEDERYFISDDKNDTLDDRLKIHSPIVGWAYDGNPIYGPYGFDTPSGGIIRRMKSGYSLSPDFQIRPNYPFGFFVEDYKFTGSGDLDVHNGRFCVTPDFPNGVYAYFCAIDENFDPQFPFIIGDSYKSTPIDFNFDRNSNQDNFDINSKNLVRNSYPYKFSSKNSQYDYIQTSFEDKSQTSLVESTESGFIDSIDIINPGTGYKIGDNLIISPSKNDFGIGANAFVEEIVGVGVSSIQTEINLTENVQIFQSNIIRGNIGIANTPHGLSDGDFITINTSSIEDTIIERKFYKINVNKYNLVLVEELNDVSSSGEIETIRVSGNLLSPFIIEDDIFYADGEKFKVLAVDVKDSRIKIVRGYENTPVKNHLPGTILEEIPRKFYFKETFDKNYIFNRKYYFNPVETVGVGTNFGVGIGVTLFFSDPGSGLSDIIIPTKSLYIKNHNLNTGDKLIYNSNGGVGIDVSNDGVNEFRLQDNQIVYVAKISKDLIGISTNRVFLSDSSEFQGSSGILFFNSTGAGDNHIFKTDYNNVLIRDVLNINSKIFTKSHHLLKADDKVNLNLISFDTKSYKVIYDPISKNLSINKKLVESVQNSILKITNHQLIRGQKVLFNSFNPPIGLSNGQKYYAIPLNKDEIKLSKSYYGSLNNTDIIDIQLTGIYDPFDPFFDQGNSYFLSLVNPKLEVFGNNSIEFDLSDPSLIGFDFNLYEDKNYNNIFYGFTDSSAIKVGSPGNSNSKLILKVSNYKEQKIYYSLSIPNRNNIFTQQLGYFNDSVNIKNNNSIIFNPSPFTGNRLVKKSTPEYFEINLDSIPENLTYIQNNNCDVNYTTSSKFASGPINKVKLNSKGKLYKKLPIISKVNTISGRDATFKIVTKNIGKIKKIRLNNIGYDYYSDKSLRPSSKVPEILTVSPTSLIDNINVVSTGINYTFSPNLVLLDGLTGKIVTDVILTFDISKKNVKIIKNTNGINNAVPKIIPINNSNGISIQSIEYNNLTKSAEIILKSSYSNEDDFPFNIMDKIIIENTEIFPNSGKPFNSSSYNYELFEIIEINPQIGGENPSIKIDLSGFIFNNEVFGKYDPINSLGIITPEKYFPEFAISLKKSTFSAGETIISDNGKIGVIESWDEINEKLKVNTVDSFDINSIITGKSSGFFGTITDKESFDSYYDMNSSSLVIKSWQDKKGFLNSDLQRIHNSDYYQYFSYSLKSNISFEEWDNSVSSLNHISGFKKFADFQILSLDKIYSGIQTSQNNGDFSSLVNIDSLLSVNCKFDYDLVQENSINVDSKLISDQIYFDSRQLTDYFDCIGNRVLSIDDISDEFRDDERLNFVTRFTV